MIVTFYSFKGGVGRSMAMANVAEILAGLGYNVIASDWDLEAPGLERYVAPDRIEAERAASQPGLVDLLAEYKATLTLPLPAEGTTSDTSTTATHASVGRVRLRRPSSYTIEMRPAGPRPGTLRLLTAGARGVRGEGYGKYAEAVRTFSWNEFYDKWAGGAYMDFLRADLAEGRGENDPAGPPIKPAADILLIDSRTGVTEHGGVATHHLADIVVLTSAANDLNLEGTSWMADALGNPRLIELRSGRKLAVLPVPARIEQTSEKNLLAQFRKAFVDRFSRRLPASLLTSAEEFFVDIEIPYMPFYSFTERVAARELPPEREVRLYRAYEALAHAIIQCGFNLKVLEKPPVESSPRFQLPVPPPSPRGVFALLGARDMHARAEVLAAALNQSQISVLIDPHAAALAGSTEASATGALLLVGPETPEPWVRAAFDAALRRQALNPEFRVVSIVDPAVRLSSVPYLNRVRIVQSSLGGTAPDVAPILTVLANPSPPVREDPAIAPFPGRRAYEEADARLFFGRDPRLVDLGVTLRSAKAAVRWLHLEGPSGIGKTSFVLASVLPAIRLGWLVAEVTPGPTVVCRTGVDPLGSLAVAMARATGDPEQTTRIRDALLKPHGLANEIRRLTPQGQTFVLFVDDVHALDERDTDPVARSLRETAADPNLSLLLITAADSGWSPSFPGSTPLAVRFDLGRMSIDDYQQAAVGPVRLAGLSWEPGALELLMDDVEAMKDSPLALPLFAAALRYVWENRSRNTLTTAAYERFGGFAVELIRQAERRLRELTPERHAAAKRLLVGLTQARPDGASVRRTITRAEALALAGGGPAAESLLASLAAPPAVIVDGDRVTLAHDIYLDRWIPLRDWVSERRAEESRRATRKRRWAAVAFAAVLIPGLLVAQLWSVRTDRARLESTTLAEAAIHAQDKDPLKALARAVAAANSAETDAAHTALARALEERYPRRVLQHGSPVIDATFNASGTHVLTAAEDNVARVWQIGKIESAQNAPAAVEIKIDARISSVRLGPSGTIGAVGAFDGTVTLLDTSTSQVLGRVSGHSGPVVSLDFSPDGRLLATASFDGTGLIWNVDTRKVVAELKGHTAALTSVLFRNDGMVLLTTSVDGTGRLWNRDGTSIATLGKSALQSANIGAFGGSRWAIGGLGGAVLGSSSGYEVPIDGSGSVVSLGFSAGGDRLVTASDDTVVVWDAANGQQIGPLITPATTKGETPRMTDLAFDRQGGHLAAGTGDGRVFVWDAAEKSAAPSAVLRVHTDAVNRVAFAGDGRQLLTASLDDTVCVWDIGPQQNPPDGSFATLRQFGQGIVSRLFTAEQLAAIVREQ